jgi:hypothetical protein
MFLSSSHSLRSILYGVGLLLCQLVACNLKPPFLGYIVLSLPPRPEVPPEAWVGCVSSNYLNYAETEKLKEIRENGFIDNWILFFFFNFQFSIFTRLHFL